MATVKASVLCNGRDLNFYSLSLDQKYNWHHSFKITMSAESIEGKNAVNIDKSKEYLGKIVDITIESTMKVDGDGLVFKGIITAVNIDRTFASDNVIVLSGYSPTYLLEDGRGCTSFEKMKGADIFGKITGDYPGNLLNTQKNEQTSRKFEYHVKYKETNYEYLSRLADTNGEWLYYNGKNFVYGKIKDVNQLDIVLGKDLTAFEYGITMKPSKFEYLTYDYTKNSYHEVKSKSFKPGWLDNYGKAAKSAGDDHFPGGHKFPVAFDIKEESDLKKQMEIRKSAILSDASIFAGESTNPSIMVSTNVGVTANGSFINRFRVINVSHYIDASKNYTNSFEALPLSTTSPPINKYVYMPKAEKQVAIVKDNKDKDGLGRVRVQMNWQTGDEQTPWLRVATGHAGGKRGIYFIPEEGDEVIVDHEFDNPIRPFVSATTFHGKASSDRQCGKKKNNLKAIITRSGHTILLDDTNGKEMIHIHDKKENEIIIDTKEETITFKALKNIVIDAGQDITLKAGKNIFMEANKENVEITAQKDIKIESKMGGLEQKTMKDIVAKSGKDLKMSAQVGAEMKANTSLKLSGNASAEIKSSGMMDVKGTKTSVQGAALAELKAAIVKIN